MSAPNGYGAFVATHLDADLRSAVEACSAVICLAAPGVPVVYVSPAFEAHTGYPPQEAVGRSLAILQGPDTEPESVALFRHLIDAQVPGTVRITNYRRDGSPFVHLCEMRPIRGADGAVSHFIAVQRPLAS